MDRYPLTPEGHEALVQELKQLTTVERIKISREIGVARDHGDISENAEYHAAKERQGQIEARISHLEGVISRAEVIDSKQLQGTRVKFGARVMLEDIDSGARKEYRIVGAEEADPAKGTISISSPVARALIQHEVGDEVRVQVPGGARSYEIVDIAWK